MIKCHPPWLAQGDTLNRCITERNSCAHAQSLLLCLCQVRGDLQNLANDVRNGPLLVLLVILLHSCSLLLRGVGQLLRWIRSFLVTDLLLELLLLLLPEHL